MQIAAGLFYATEVTHHNFVKKNNEMMCYKKILIKVLIVNSIQKKKKQS